MKPYKTTLYEFMERNGLKAVVFIFSGDNCKIYNINDLPLEFCAMPIDSLWLEIKLDRLYVSIENPNDWRVQ